MKANYGIDAPTVLRNLVIGAVVGLVGGAVVSWFDRSLGRPLISMGLGCTIGASILLWGSLRGKLRTRDRLLGAVPWRGDERVLDVGCGHGLLLIGAAKRLPNGRAIGIDIWQNVDQANNSAEATRRNATIEGVADRVEVRDGDARTIPFEGDQFDVVVSSLAIHNIYDRGEREQALREIARVTKPGGHVAIADVLHGSAYAKFFARQGFTIVRNALEPPYIFPCRTVVVRKPLSSRE